MPTTSTRWAGSCSTHGVYVTLAAYPLVPRQEVGFRLQLTAANTDAEVDQLIDVLAKLANAFDLQPAAESCGMTSRKLFSRRHGLALVPRRRLGDDRGVPVRAPVQRDTPG